MKTIINPAILAVFFAVLSSCSTNPFTGRSTQAGGNANQSTVGFFQRNSNQRSTTSQTTSQGTGTQIQTQTRGTRGNIKEAIPNQGNYLPDTSSTFDNTHNYGNRP